MSAPSLCMYVGMHGHIIHVYRLFNKSPLDRRVFEVSKYTCTYVHSQSMWIATRTISNFQGSVQITTRSHVLKMYECISPWKRFSMVAELHFAASLLAHWSPCWHQLRVCAEQEAARNPGTGPAARHDQHCQPAAVVR